MTDLELLTLAAKAAGIHYDAEASKPHPVSGAFFGLWLKFDREPHELDRRSWNPLTDDGDALRLAVKLKINIEHMETLSRVPFGVNCWPVGRGDCGKNETGPEALADYPAATRRAIVRAAAATQRAPEAGEQT